MSLRRTLSGLAVAGLALFAAGVEAGTVQRYVLAAGANDGETMRPTPYTSRQS